ncbi:hypothetical protein [uncultured Methylobacterium sp.]|uniref:hypothetical protein n=1 Tax=uncultured Methylobacterium sp. TaxID=157278 RepID=UPI0035CAD949
MTELARSIITTWFGMGGGIVALAAVLVLIFVPVLGRRIATVLAPIVLLLLALGYVERLQDDLATARADLLAVTARAEKAETDASHLADVASGNARTVQVQAEKARADALAYDADAVAKASDDSRIALALEAASIAARATACPPEGRARVSEDDPLPGSLGAAMDALRQGSSR